MPPQAFRSAARLPVGSADRFISAFLWIPPPIGGPFSGQSMSPKHILLVPALALLMYLGMYSWNQRTHILDNFAANTGLEASGVVLKSVRMVQDTVMGAWNRYLDLVDVREENDELKKPVSYTHLNAAIHNVGGKFRRGLFKSDAHGLDDAVHLFGNGLADFLRGDDDVLRDAGHEIAALDLDLLLGVHRVGGGDLNLDLFCGGFADQHVILALYVRHDGFVHLVAADAHRTGIHDTRQGDDLSLIHI